MKRKEHEHQVRLLWSGLVLTGSGFISFLIVFVIVIGLLGVPPLVLAARVGLALLVLGVTLPILLQLRRYHHSDEKTDRAEVHPTPNNYPLSLTEPRGTTGGALC